MHRVECAGVARMKSAGRAEVGVRWGDTTECRVTLVAESFGRPHLLADLTEAIALEGVEIVSATVEPPSQQRVRHTYTLQLPDAAHLPALMRAMRNVPGVYDVSRAQHAGGGRAVAPDPAAAAGAPGDTPRCGAAVPDPAGPECGPAAATAARADEPFECVPRHRRAPARWSPSSMPQTPHARRPASPPSRRRCSPPPSPSA